MELDEWAQSAVGAMRAGECKYRFLAEERVLGGDLTYHRPEERLPADEERFVLLAMHKILIDSGLCLREHTDDADLPQLLPVRVPRIN